MLPKVFTALLCLAGGVAAGRAGYENIRQMRLQALSYAKEPGAAGPADINPVRLYPAHNISVPIDHFHNESMYEPHSDGKFNLRYWFDASYYKPGGPVIILASGEADGTERLPYLQKGILAELAQATNGIGVVLEHRYYGTSIPTSDLSTESLRFLTTDQALADTVYFAENIVFEGLENYNLTASNTPYIAYGGSYAGAFVAFLRTLYPGTFWGAISSSGVTLALYDYWQYYQPIVQYGPQTCIKNLQYLTNVVDHILLEPQNKDLIPTLKKAFGLEGLNHDEDFASALSFSTGYWQERNWDPAVNSPVFHQFCEKLSSNEMLYPATAGLKPTVQKLFEAANYSSQAAELMNPMLNYIGFVNETVVQQCPAPSTLNDCYSNYNFSYYAQDDINQSWRTWPYQYCTQWGYLMPGSTTPSNLLPIISRAVTLEYEALICKHAFNITTPSDVDAINRYGNLTIAYPRLAIIGGEADVWRPVTPLADNAPSRVNTTSEPVYLIEGAVHHWDENGLFPNQTTATLPPDTIKMVHAAEAAFVQAWLAEWTSCH